MTETDWKHVAAKLLTIAEYFFHSTIDSSVYDDELDEKYAVYMDEIRALLNGASTR